MQQSIRLVLATLGLAVLNISVLDVQAQFNYVTNNGTITITKYIGPGGAVQIPSTINGLPVTTLGTNYDSGTSGASDGGCSSGAFQGCFSVTSVTIPDTVVTIVDGSTCSFLTSFSGFAGVFAYCINLTNVTILGNGLRNLGDFAFYGCDNLSNINIPEGVTRLGEGAFNLCASLTSIKIPSRVTRLEDGHSYSIYYPVDGVFAGCTSLTNVMMGEALCSIGDFAFWGCDNLHALFFGGNAPILGSNVFDTAANLTVYFLPGTTGWGATFGGRPTAPWVLPYPVVLSTAPNFGIQTNAFGFRISWATSVTVVVEASTTLASPVWPPVSTNTLVDGWTYFSDGEWTNYPARFYRVRQW